MAIRTARDLSASGRDSLAPAGAGYSGALVGGWVVRVLKGLVYLLFFVVIAAVSFAVVARFSEGGIGPFPGRPLASGPLVDEAVSDWSFAADVGEVTLQLLVPPRSRTTWIVVRDGKAYIPCATPSFRLWKQWPHQAMADGRALVRIDGKRYRVDLTRLDDPPLEEALKADLNEKYDVPEQYPAEIWLFALGARSAG